MTDTESMAWEGRHLYRTVDGQREYVGSVICSTFAAPGQWMVWMRGRCRATCHTEKEAREKLEAHA